MYYDDPLISAYMQREFNVQYEVETSLTTGYPYVEDLLRNYIDGWEYKYHIHPDSIGIFKPQTQDIGLDGASRVCKWVGNKWIVLDAPRHECEPVYPVQIISRGQVDVDLKRFFTPKKEESC